MFQMMVCMSIFLLISTLESRLSATGHFEIFYNGECSYCLEPTRLISHRYHLNNSGTLSITPYYGLVFVTDVPVWSKLASGRFPSPGELFQIIDNQILIKNTPKLSL